MSEDPVSQPSPSPSRLRRRLMAAGAGTLATAGLGAFGRSASAQSTVELPFANDQRQLVA